MSKAKFTKGPWYCANYSARAAQTGKFIAHADNNSVNDERKANANLIAAAPEMYDQNEEYISILKALLAEGYVGYSDKLQKALMVGKKARGEQ